MCVGRPERADWQLLSGLRVLRKRIELDAYRRRDWGNMPPRSLVRSWVEHADAMSPRNCWQRDGARRCLGLPALRPRLHVPVVRTRLPEPPLRRGLLVQWRGGGRDRRHALPPRCVAGVLQHPLLLFRALELLLLMVLVSKLLLLRGLV